MDSYFKEALGGSGGGCVERSLKASLEFTVEFRLSRGVAPLWIYLHEEQISLLGEREELTLMEMRVEEHKPGGRSLPVLIPTQIALQF